MWTDSWRCSSARSRDCSSSEQPRGAPRGAPPRIQPGSFRTSSTVEQAAVNRKVRGSNPRSGANPLCKFADNLEWLEGVLRPADFTVLLAHGGSEGIAVAKDTHPHLILLDLMMPDVSGFDVVEALRADEATRSIPVMIITAKDLTDDDKRQLNGHVGAILARSSTGATDLLGWLR